MKKLLLLPLLSVVLLVGSASAQTKIALIDLEGAMNQSEAGAKASDEIRADIEKAQAKGQKLAAEIESISKDLEAQRSVLSQDAIQKKMVDIQKKKVELERLEKDTNDELQRKQMQLFSGIMQEMSKVIADYAKEKGFDLVLEAKESGTVFASPKLNITDDIVKRFNSTWKNTKQ